MGFGAQRLLRKWDMEGNFVLNGCRQTGHENVSVVIDNQNAWAVKNRAQRTQLTEDRDPIECVQTVITICGFQRGN